MVKPTRQQRQKTIIKVKTEELGKKRESIGQYIDGNPVRLESINKNIQTVYKKQIILL